VVLTRALVGGQNDDAEATHLQHHRQRRRSRGCPVRAVPPLPPTLDDLILVIQDRIGEIEAAIPQGDEEDTELLR